MISQDTLRKQREELKTLIVERSFQRGSHYRTPAKVISSYFDFLEISLKHQGVQLASNLVWNELKDLNIVAVGGPGDAIKSIFCRVAYLMEIGVFYIRDSMRKEGDMRAPKWLVSRIKQGDKIALVGDVVSSGSQVIRAIEEVIQFGASVERVVVVIDSEEGKGIERIKQFLKTNLLDTSLRVIFTKTELFANSPLSDKTNEE